jgi:hypothetical protein
MFARFVATSMTLPMETLTAVLNLGPLLQTSLMTGPAPSAEQPKTSLKRKIKPQGLSSTNISVTFRSVGVVCLCYRISFSRPCPPFTSLRAVGSTSRKPAWKPYGLEAGTESSQKPGHRPHGPEARGYLLPQGR